jgi:hypothetical protein
MSDYHESYHSHALGRKHGWFGSATHPGTPEHGPWHAETGPYRWLWWCVWRTRRLAGGKLASCHVQPEECTCGWYPADGGEHEPWCVASGCEPPVYETTGIEAKLDKPNGS